MIIKVKNFPHPHNSLCIQFLDKENDEKKHYDIIILKYRNGHTPFEWDPYAVHRFLEVISGICIKSGYIHMHY